MEASARRTRHSCSLTKSPDGNLPATLPQHTATPTGRGVRSATTVVPIFRGRCCLLLSFFSGTLALYPALQPRSFPSPFLLFMPLPCHALLPPGSYLPMAQWPSCGSAASFPRVIWRLPHGRFWGSVWPLLLFRNFFTVAGSLADAEQQALLSKRERLVRGTCGRVGFVPCAWPSVVTGRRG
jgi:hypothetical protein